MFSAPAPSQPHDLISPQVIDNLTPLPPQDHPTVDAGTNPPQPTPSSTTRSLADEEAPSQESTPMEEDRTPINTPSEQIFNPDRPTRRRKQVQLYDAHSGTYKDRTS